MLFGCPLPDDLDGASIGQCAVAKAFEMILSSAAKMHPNTLYQAICDAHKQQGNDTKLVRCPSCVCVKCVLMSPLHSQHSNWNHYGTRLSQMVVWELLISWLKHAVIASL